MKGEGRKKDEGRGEGFEPLIPTTYMREWVCKPERLRAGHVRAKA